MSRRPRPSDGPPLEAVLEALIFAADTPLTLPEMTEVLGTGEQDLGSALERLEERLERGDGGLRLERVAGGFRMATRSDVGEWVRSLYRSRNRRRLSPAGLETLAIVAYRQPITAPEIQQLRGVDPQGALASLLERHLVRIVGRKRVVGRPLLYGTTREFLMHFGLDDLGDLPSLDAFGDVLPPADRESLFASGPAASSDEIEPLAEEETAGAPGQVAVVTDSESGGDHAGFPDGDRDGSPAAS